MPATIKDIAARVGVSHTTVSRALGDYRFVSDDLRRRILAAARELNYLPNAQARALKDRRTRVIGLIIPDLMNDFYASAATIIQASLAADGFRLLLGVSNNDPRTEADYLRAMLEERVDGLLWVPRATHAAALRDFARAAIPIIHFTRHAAASVGAVVADDRGGATAATRHLLRRGHRRIGLLVGPTELSTARERVDGYTRALADAGLAADRDLVRVGAFERGFGRAATDALLGLAHPPTAIFATSSELVVGALQALRGRGLRVPDDLSLVGFGDPEWFAIWHPPLTTVAFAIEDMAGVAVHALLRRVRDRHASTVTAPVVSRLSCQLVERASVRPLEPSPSGLPDRG